MYILTINAGSSSIKFCLFNADNLAQEYTGVLSGIGFDSATLTVAGAQQISKELTVADHAEATRVIQDWIVHSLPQDKITAVGHRVVHGGPNLTASCLIDEHVLDELRRATLLDPEHLPTQVSIIEHLGQIFTDIPQVACFDTAFFHELPAVSRLLPLPRRLEAEGIRRYGFHGLSYSYLLQEFERVAGHQAANGKVIFAHLGNGASLAAVKNGKPIDTSMGLTPAGGIPMSTRSGDLDPGILVYLATQERLNPEQLNHLIGFESGLLGISEASSDMKELLDIEAQNPHAHDAVEIFCYQVRKYIGSYAAAMGGLDSLVFSGGIGEVSVPIRSRICQELAFLGIVLDDERNQANVECISADGAGVGVHVLATNEALMIARDIKQLLNTQS